MSQFPRRPCHRTQLCRGKHWRCSTAKLRAETLVSQAIADAGQGRILELPMGMPFRSAVVKAGADQLLFVVHPRDKDWCLTGIRRKDEGFELRADLPAAGRV